MPLAWTPKINRIRETIAQEENKIRTLQQSPGEYKWPSDEPEEEEPEGQPIGWPWEWAGVATRGTIEEIKEKGWRRTFFEREGEPVPFAEWGETIRGEMAKGLEEQRELPWQEQLAYEAPFWALTFGLPTATGIRAGLAAKAARPGIEAVAPKVVRGALLPVELGEKAIATGLKYGIGLPLKYGVAKPIELGVRKAFEKALDKGLDVWIVRQAIRADQAPKVVEFFIKKNRYWLFNKAQANITKRMAERKAKKWGVEQAVKVAANDTVKEAEPFLLQAAKDAGVEIKPIVVKPPVAEVAKPPINRVAISATPTQTEQIWAIGLDKALISEAGKFNPNFRRLLVSQTGQAGTKKTTKALLADMTEAEAETVLEALKRLPEPTIKGRTKIPPTISRVTKIVPENFFNLQFGEPTPIKYFTSQVYYAQKLGVKPLVEPLELAKQRLDLEFPAWEKAVDSKINEMNKIWGVSAGERLQAKLKHIPTRAVAELRDLLNKYETLPAELVDKMPIEQVKLFSWFRNVNRTIINGENQVRRLLGMEEIPYREAYVRHVPDALAQEILLGNHPLPEALKYWATRIVGKRIYNPMEMQRQLSADLAEYFTKDLAYATKSMIWTGLKEIHLSEPLASFSEQMGAFTKDLKQWKHLFPAEFERFQKINVLPASTRRWVTDYVNQVIKGQQTFFDEEINRIAIKTGFSGLMNKVLKPLGRTLGLRPFTNLTSLAGRLTILSVMTPRPGLVKMIIRNLFQHTQDTALYGIKPSLKGYYPASLKSSDPEIRLLAELLDESLFLKGYTGFEQLPTAIQGKIERMALWPYGRSAIFNARTGMKTAHWATLPLVKKPKNKEFGWTDPQRTYTEPKGFVYPSERELLKREMEWGAGATQYQYIAMGMPQIFRTKTLLPFTRLQSWWMNHFFRFHREAMYRFLKGKPTYADDFARTYGRTPRLPWSMRVNYLKYLVLGGAILTGMGYTTSYLLGVLPYNLAPAGQFAIGVWRYISADTDWQRAEAKREIFNSWRAIVPGALALKELEDLWSGKKAFWQIFFYGREEQGAPPRPPTWGIIPEQERGGTPGGRPSAPGKYKWPP